MWSVIRAFTRAADLTLVPSATMKATLSGELERFFFFSSFFLFLFFFFCELFKNSKNRKISLFFSLFSKTKKRKTGEGCGQPIDVWRQAVDTEFFNPR